MTQANRTAAPYGSWVSPITAEDVAGGSEPVIRAQFFGADIWFSRRIAHEGGRTTIHRLGDTGSEPEEVLPREYNVRTRVHEYGGGDWVIDEDDAVLYFVNSRDQRVYSLALSAKTQRPEPGRTPRPVTAETNARVRYGDLTYQAGTVLAVQETHSTDGTVSRAIVSLDAAGPVVLAEGPHFLAWPRLSPRRTYLSFIGWEHPDMPWDSTTLYVQPLVDSVPIGRAEAVVVGIEESLLQPEWLSSQTLSYLSDRTGAWGLYSFDVPTFLARAQGKTDAGPAEDVDLLVTEGEIGGPLWSLGAKWYIPTFGGNRILAESRHGASRLVWANPDTGDVSWLSCPLTTFALQDFAHGRALLIGGSADRITGLYLYDVASGETTPVALSQPHPANAAYYPSAEEREFDGVPAVYYPPHNPDFTASAGELPPCVAFVHGGPTSQATARVSATYAFFTSRGIGVIDVNYGGSTGFGRAWRDRLKGAWGIVDVEDTVTAVRGLAEEGLADPARLAIRGGSAGGFTVLSALTRDTTFACGASHYGVAELTRFVTETHDFESHYVDSLIGPLPQSARLYEERAPLNHLDRLQAPVAVFQGDQDPIVPMSQATRLISGLEERGLPYTATVYKGESHGFIHPENVVDALNTELSFYGRVMGFATPGIPEVRLKGRGRS